MHFDCCTTQQLQFCLLAEVGIRWPAARQVQCLFAAEFLRARSRPRLPEGNERRNQQPQTDTARRATHTHNLEQTLRKSHVFTGDFSHFPIRIMFRSC